MVAALRAAATFPVYKPVGAGLLCVAWGTYTHATNLAATTVIEYCRVPAGARIVGGYWATTEIDAHDTEELDIDIGYAANGVDLVDTDAFGNLGALNSDAYPTLAGTGLWVPFQGRLLTEGPILLQAETVLTGIVNVDAATTGTGQSTMVAYYTVD